MFPRSQNIATPTELQTLLVHGRDYRQASALAKQALLQGLASQPLLACLLAKTPGKPFANLAASPLLALLPLALGALRHSRRLRGLLPLLGIAAGLVAGYWLTRAHSKHSGAQATLVRYRPVTATGR